MKTGRELDTIGFTWARGALDQPTLEQLKSLLDTGPRPGDRLDREAISHLKGLIKPVISRARELLPDCKIVQATTFNKSEETNWSVGWHQDRVIAVKEKHEVDGYGNWTNKKGIWYCEPPARILENMLFARIHLDTSTPDNGCLVVANGSHLSGRLDQSTISKTMSKFKAEFCDAQAGDVMFGKSLLIHRSNPSTVNSQRLAIKLDFSNQILPTPLQWYL